MSNTTKQKATGHSSHHDGIRQFELMAVSLGFKAEKNFDEIIKVYQQDEMGK